MRRRARASGVGGGKGPRRGLWSLIRRMFGTPRGRHVIGVSPAPAASSPEVDSQPVVAQATPVTPEMVGPDPKPARDALGGEVTLPAPVPTGLAPVPTGLTSIQLIFTDGSVVPLPEGSLEGRQAQELARRVLEAGRGS